MYNGMNEIMPFAETWVNLEIIILSGISQTEKDKYHMISSLMQNLKKNDTNELTYLQNRDRLGEGTYGYQGERQGERLGVWD